MNNYLVANLFRKTIFSLIVLSSIFGWSQKRMTYEIDFQNREQHLFNVKMTFTSKLSGTMDFQISQWTPGYYQILDFPKNILNLKAQNSSRKALEIIKIEEDKWRIPITKGEEITINYQIEAKTEFIAKPFINKEYAFIRPTGIYLFPLIDHQEKYLVKFKNNLWKDVATGLKKEKSNYFAENIDELLDSPILVGDLNDLGFFTINRKKHYFLGRQLDDFDSKNMMSIMRKVVKEAIDIFDDIPYRDYTFISIGKGNGGIEQTNSTALTFNGELYKTESGKQKLLNFLTHEYFHHFNAKRIRALEMTPLNFSKENRTNLLWISEGLTVYYESVLMNRAGAKTKDQMLEEWRRKIEKFENNPGRKNQTLAQSSSNTWEDGPFGIPGKTISYYEKGPLIGMLLDLKIRANTQNKNSLDDVMKKLYWDFYKKQNRGFTEKEFRKVAEKFAGENLDEIFSYIYTVNEINYDPYFKFAGIDVIRTNLDDKTKITFVQTKNQTPLQQEIQDDLFRNTSPIK